MTHDQDAIEAVRTAHDRIANAITALGVMAGKDAAGGTVMSLTEAVMGITSGLYRVAEAIDHLADAVRK